MSEPTMDKTPVDVRPDAASQFEEVDLFDTALIQGGCTDDFIDEETSEAGADD